MNKVNRSEKQNVFSFFFKLNFFKRKIILLIQNYNKSINSIYIYIYK